MERKAGKSNSVVKKHQEMIDWKENKVRIEEQDMRYN